MNLKDYIRSIPDYPKKGILFRDITTLIKNEKAFTYCIDQIVEKSKQLFAGSFGSMCFSKLSIRFLIIFFAFAALSKRTFITC